MENLITPGLSYLNTKGNPCDRVSKSIAMSVPKQLLPEKINIRNIAVEICPGHHAFTTFHPSLCLPDYS
jgi:hypothetical protein